MRKKISILGFFLMIGWMAVIFFFSSKTGNQIELEKGPILKVFINIFEGKKIASFSIEEQELLISKYSFYISKTAHYLEYGLLCFFCFLTFFHLKKHNLRYIISLIICIVYAITDEYHQSFSSGRTPRIQDVLIDFLGALTMALIIELIRTIYYIYKDRKRND